MILSDVYMHPVCLITPTTTLALTAYSQTVCCVPLGRFDMQKEDGT